MAVTVTTAATDPSLARLESIKTQLGITGSSEDSLLIDLIREASDLIVSYCDRSFIKESITETLPGLGTPRLMLSRVPVISISQIKYRDQEPTSSDDYVLEDPYSGFVFSKRGVWTSTHRFDEWITFNTTRYSNYDWEVKYTAGYVLYPDSSEERTLPYDIERACSMLVKSAWFARSSNPNVVRRRIGDAEEAMAGSISSYASPLPKDALGLPFEVISILSKHRAYNAY